MVPTTMPLALRWAEYIAHNNGVYREAIKRICSYCITQITVVDDKEAISHLDEERRDRYLKLLSPEGINGVKLTNKLAYNLLVYGNVYVSVHSRFTRYLECPHCHHEVPSKTARENDSYKFSFQNFEFKCTCPICGKSSSFLVEDRYSKNPEDIYVKFWNPHDIEIKTTVFDEQPIILWKIPQQDRAMIRSGDNESLETCPLEVIRCVRDGTPFRFYPEAIMHAKEEALVGVRSYGWGIPRIISNFRSAWLWQIVHRYNEALATDYIMGLRCISPVPGPTQQIDPLMSSGMTEFKDRVGSAIQEFRRDPGMWFISPVALQYQTLGGDAAKFIPRELLEYARDNLLSSTGIPVDMYQGTMQLQSAPVSLRLFETNWDWLISACNEFINFVVKRSAYLMNEEPIAVKFTRITHADDINRQSMQFQLMSAGELSRTNVLKSLGFDKREEDRLMLEEDKHMAELQEDMQNDENDRIQFEQMVPNGMQTAMMNMQQAQQGGMPMGPSMGGGMPMGGGGMPQGGGGMGVMGAPMGVAVNPISQMIAQWGQLPSDTPEDMTNKADTIVQQIAQMGPQRPYALRELKRNDEMIHALVQSKLQEYDRQMGYQDKQNRMMGGAPQ